MIISMTVHSGDGSSTEHEAVVSREQLLAWALLFQLMNDCSLTYNWPDNEASGKYTPEKSYCPVRLVTIADFRSILPEGKDIRHIDNISARAE